MIIIPCSCLDRVRELPPFWTFFRITDHLHYCCVWVTLIRRRRNRIRNHRMLYWNWNHLWWRLQFWVHFQFFHQLWFPSSRHHSSLAREMNKLGAIIRYVFFFFFNENWIYQIKRSKFFYFYLWIFYNIRNDSPEHIGGFFKPNSSIILRKIHTTSFIDVAPSEFRLSRTD